MKKYRLVKEIALEATVEAENKQEALKKEVEWQETDTTMPTQVFEIDEQNN